MAQGGETDAVNSDGPSSFAHALDELKSRGSTLLVVGSVPEEMYANVSARMLGDGSVPRRRLIVTPLAGAPQVDGRLASVEHRTPEWTRVIQYESHARHAAVAEGGSSPTDSPAELGVQPTENHSAVRQDPLAHVVDGSLTELGMEIAKTIDQFDGIAVELDPAELRVAFDCLPSLLSEYDRETVFRFVHVLGNHVRSVGGMAHFWLPQDRHAEVTRLFEPLFDATVELRLDGHELLQRWSFRDSDVTSMWLSRD